MNQIILIILFRNGGNASLHQLSSGNQYNYVVQAVLTLFSMGYFKNTTVWGPPCNFGVSYGRRIKFGGMGYFDVLSSKMALIFKLRASMTSL